MTTTITVSTAAELEAALRKATGGETILLESGNYGDLTIGTWTPIEAAYASKVKIASADPDNPASFSGLSTRDVTNLSFENVTFDYRFADGDPYYERPFLVSGGSNISFENCLFDGDRAAPDGHNVTGTGFGLEVRDAVGVTVEDCEFQDFYKALMVRDSDDVRVAGNDVHDMRSDGFNFTAVQGVVIEDNHFHSFDEAVGSADHRDFVQFWTTGADRPNTDIVIRGNLFDVADGSWTQSVFMRNELVDTGQAGSEMFYQNVLIEDNVILNDHPHGITVGETSGLTIQNNTLLMKESGGSFGAPAINVADPSRDVTIVRNVTEKIQAKGTGWTVENNVLVQDDNEKDPNHYSDMFYLSTIEDGGIPTVRAGSLADKLGAGASTTFLNGGASGEISLLSQNDAARAGFDVFGVAGEPMSRVFDGASIMLDQGYDKIEIAEMEFHWNFADGTTADGAVARRDFETTGWHEVELTVTWPDGREAATRAVVPVSSPTLLASDQKGLTLQIDGEQTLVQAANMSADGGLQLGQSGVALLVDGSDLDRLYDAEAFRLDFSVTASNAGDQGEILHFYNGMRLQYRDSKLILEVFTDLEERIWLPVNAVPPLNDGAAHDVSVRYDGDAHRMELFIDGALAAAAAFQGEFGMGDRQGFAIGNAWGGDNLACTIRDLDLQIIDAVTTYEGPFSPVVADVVPSEPQSPAVGEPEVEEGAAPMRGEDAPVVDQTGVSTNELPLFDLATLSSEDIVVHGDVSLGGIDGSPSIRMNGDGGYARLVGLDNPENDGAFTVSLSYMQDDPGASARLLWNHQTFGIEVKSEVVRVYTKVEGSDRMKVFAAKADSLDEAGERNISVAIDSDLDRIQIVVDGEVVLDDTSKADIDLRDGDGGYDWGWWIGTPWNRWFDGEVTGLTVQDEAMFEPPEFHPDDSSLLS